MFAPLLSKRSIILIRTFSKAFSDATLAL